MRIVGAVVLAVALLCAWLYAVATNTAYSYGRSLARRERRRVERARQFAQSDTTRRFRPVTVMPSDQSPAQKESNGKKKPRSFRDKLLFVIEVIAVVGLLAIIVDHVVLTARMPLLASIGIAGLRWREA